MAARARSAVAIGFRVKSGWALAVLVAGPIAAPRVLDRRRIELSDPKNPKTRQPHHEGFGKEQSNARVVRRLVAIVTRCARAAVTRLLKDYGEMGHAPRRAGLVVGSLIDPAAIANPHIRAHASEGRLFRVALEGALRRRGLTAVVERERDVYDAASRGLRRPAQAIRAAVAQLGAEVAGPWRAEEKTAAAVALLALAPRGVR